MSRYVEYKQQTFRLTNGYYKRHITIFLHRQIWEDNFGPIPKGFHIHHKDGDKLNNEINNLECLSASDHHKTTWKDDDGTQRDIARRNIKKAIEWRYTKEAKPIISEKNKKSWLNRKFENCICFLCGNIFQSRMPKLAKWCSKKCCKSYHYEKEKLNDMANKQSDSS